MRLLATIDEYLKIRSYMNYEITDDIYGHFANRTVYWIYYNQKHNIITIMKPDEPEPLGLYKPLGLYEPLGSYDVIDRIDLNLSDPQLLNKIENVLLGKL